MIDLRVSFRALRVTASFGMLTILSGVLAGCSGETPPAATAENTASSSAASTNPKKAEAKQVGSADKSIMPEIPKKPK